MKKSYYDILGIPENANQESINRAYKRRAMACHPDRGKLENQNSINDISTTKDLLLVFQPK